MNRLPMPNPIDRAYVAWRNFNLRCTLLGHRSDPYWGTAEQGFCLRCRRAFRREPALTAADRVEQMIEDALETSETDERPKKQS